MSRSETDTDPRWSPYRTSAASMLLALALVSIAVAAFLLLPGRARAWALVPFFAAVVIPNLMTKAANCPTCGKSAMHFGVSQDWLLPLWRLWPERHCSSCGRDLTRRSGDG